MNLCCILADIVFFARILLGTIAAYDVLLMKKAHRIYKNVISGHAVLPAEL